MAQCKLSPTWKWLPHQFLVAFSYVFVFLSVLWSASHLLQFVARLENWPFFLQLVSPCPLLPWDQKPTKHHIIPTHLSVLAYSNLYHLTSSPLQCHEVCEWDGATLKPFLFSWHPLFPYTCPYPASAEQDSVLFTHATLEWFPIK